MLIRFLVWGTERGLELLFGAALALAIFGWSDFPRGATLIEEVRGALFIVGFFYVASAYVISCIAFGLMSRKSSPLHHGGLMAALFLAHACIFFLFTSGDRAFPLAAVAGGAAAVLLINASGAAVLAKTQDRRGLMADQGKQ